MQNQKENLFQNKFNLLNSQEHAEEIIWSLSDSSEYEEAATTEKFNNLTNKTRTLKRKRKKNAPKNISNLSITVFDTSKSSKEVRSGDTSPILGSKKHLKSLRVSPILAPTQTCKRTTSPVLPSRGIQLSPILTPKINSPKTTGKTKNKLFEKTCENVQDIIVKTEVNSDCDLSDIEANLTCPNLSPILSVKVKEETSMAKLKLVNKVKSFFDNHFSSENSTQTSESISEIHTQNNKSDEVEILSCKTHTSSNNTLIVKQENLSNQSSESYYVFNTSKKKNRYKRDGLAYRLNNILRKQNACLSLWHHERFLAANSNFIIPKGEYTVFRIQKVNFQYGCFLLDVVDLDEEDCLILINSCYVSDNLKCDTIIKVYEPYKVVQHKNNKLLINVCRFECNEYKV